MSPNPFEHFRTNLVPQGTSDLVRLSLSRVSYFSHEFVISLIDELETKAFLVGAGMDTLTSTDILVMEVLRASSSWESPHS